MRGDRVLGEQICLLRCGFDVPIGSLSGHVRAVETSMIGALGRMGIWARVCCLLKRKQSVCDEDQDRGIESIL